MIDTIWFVSLIYWLLSLVILFPPQEAVSAGLTIEHIFKFCLGSDIESFVFYQIRRSTITIYGHCLLIPGYIATLWWFHPWIVEYMKTTYYELCFPSIVILSIIPVLISSIASLIWYKDGWRGHPLMQNIFLYSSNDRPLHEVTANIDAEYLRVDKFSSQSNSISRLIATASWLIKVSSYKVNLVSLQDAIVVLRSSEEAPMTIESTTPSQFLILYVTSVREGVQPFYFRMNSRQWRDLELKLINPVINSKQIVIHKSLADRFTLAFESAVKENPTVTAEGELDLCIGCMAIAANVKILRRCRIFDSSSECSPCSCNPMWCLTCLSKWFAARQDQNDPSGWLASRAPCPTCRSAFCLLDVCLIS